MEGVGLEFEDESYDASNDPNNFRYDDECDSEGGGVGEYDSSDEDEKRRAKEEDEMDLRVSFRGEKRRRTEEEAAEEEEDKQVNLEHMTRKHKLRFLDETCHLTVEETNGDVMSEEEIKALRKKDEEREKMYRCREIKDASHLYPEYTYEQIPEKMKLEFNKTRGRPPETQEERDYDRDVMKHILHAAEQYKGQENVAFHRDVPYHGILPRDVRAILAPFYSLGIKDGHFPYNTRECASFGDFVKRLFHLEAIDTPVVNTFHEYVRTYVMEQHVKQFDENVMGLMGSVSKAEEDEAKVQRYKKLVMTCVLLYMAVESGRMTVEDGYEYEEKVFRSRFKDRTFSSLLRKTITNTNVY